MTSAKKILVTGGAGYIGSLLIPKLVKDSYEICIIDNFTYRNKSALKQFINHPQVTIVEDSILHAPHIDRYFKNVDTVIHLAAIVGDQACDVNQSRSYKINVEGTKVIVGLSRKHKVKHVIYSSSCSIYGASSYAIDEYSPLNPLSLYARTKVEAENYVSHMAHNGCSVTAIRFATLLGLSPRMRYDLVVNLLTAKAIYEGKITIFGGQQWRPFLHVDDATTALQCIINDVPIHPVNIYNVGYNENNFTLQTIGESIHTLVPNATKVIDSKQIDNRNYRVDFSKFIRDFHFTPKWSLEEGVQEMIRVLESSKLDYRNKQYNNYEYLNSKK